MIVQIARDVVKDIGYDQEGFSFQGADVEVLSQAGAMTPELRATLQTTGPDKAVPVIITLSNKVDTSTYARTAGSMRRSKMIKALREKADPTPRGR